ncbi:MAG: phosphotransferase [Thermomicrobiales bacterium]|nr:phosphotransferase [Thermomicrobiales bacterium]
MSFSFPELDALFLNARVNVPAVEQLGGGAVRRDAEGHPVRAAGRHNVVYELRTLTGRILVLRVPQNPGRERDQALAQRYVALQQDHLLDPLRAPHGPLPGNIQWLPDGLRLRDSDGSVFSCPLVVMERVAGRTLREMATRLCQSGDGSHIAMIADRWLESALAMEAAGFVHGDLSPDNIMVRPDGAIAVVDLDSATWPGFRVEHEAPESDSALRHPQGVPRNPIYRDRFPALMLWAALRILAARPDLLPELPAHGLLFSNADVRRPAASSVFARLEADEGPLRLLLEVVRRAIRFAPEELPPLSEIASRLDTLGFPRQASRPSARPARAARAQAASALGTPGTPDTLAQLPLETTPAPARPVLPPNRTAVAGDTHQNQRLGALHTAIQQRDEREALRLWAELREAPAAQVYATVLHQLVAQETHAAIDRALRRRDDDALLYAMSQAAAAGVAPNAAALTATRLARRRVETRAVLAAALDADDHPTLVHLHRTGQLSELGPLDPAITRALARALARQSVERAVASDDDVAICAAADPGLWREEETRPHALWTRLDLAWQRSRWTQDVRAALRRRDAPYLRGLLAKAPSGAEARLTDVERRRVQRTIARGQAASRLESALREGPDREVVEALAELESSGAPFSDELDWSAVRGVVDRLSLADSLRAAMATEPPDMERMARLLPAARAALGDLQRAGPEWAELEQAVLRAAHLERLREALGSGDDSRIAAAADPDPFHVRGLLGQDEAAIVAAVLGRTHAQVRRHAS